MDRTLFFILVLFYQFCFSQSSKTLSKIDSLKTDIEAVSFIRSCSQSKDDFLSEFRLKTIRSFEYDNLSPLIKRTADSLGVDKSFYKGDFDHNGKTDLLFIGDDNSCQSSRGSCSAVVKVIFDIDNKYMTKSLLLNHFDFVIPKLSTINGKDYISVFYDEVTEDFNSEKYNFYHKIVNKILTYKFDNFVEYNPEPQKYTIEKIFFETEPCFGTCPVFTLELSKNGTSQFIAKTYNFINRNDSFEKIERKSRKTFEKGEGKFTTQIKASDFQKIETILGYINFPELQDDYSVSWTDDQLSTLTITYDNGKIKKIKDYGLVGSYGLTTLYKTLFDLRFNQEWKKIKH